MLRNLNFNSIVWILLGLACLVYGGYSIWLYRRAIVGMFQFPFGLVFTGIAMIFCGLTNGFTDISPLGRKFTKAGLFFFIPGIPLLLWGVWRSI